MRCRNEWQFCLQIWQYSFLVSDREDDRFWISQKVVILAMRQVIRVRRGCQMTREIRCCDSKVQKWMTVVYTYEDTASCCLPWERDYRFWISQKVVRLATRQTNRVWRGCRMTPGQTNHEMYVMNAMMSGLSQRKWRHRQLERKSRRMG